MKTEILFVRHGETEWNKTGRFQGSTDISLSEDGILQAKYLMERLNNKFDYVFTSPLSRAYHTATILCQKNPDLEPVIVDNLTEINFGAWEGLTIEQIKEQYPIEHQNWKIDEDNGYLVGGDLTIKNASTRAKDAILDIVNSHKGKRIVIVAHGGILKAGLIGLFGWKMTMYHKFFLGNTSITKVTLSETLSPVLVSLNDTSHLPQD
jgi:broad specificity phosphatase PhoE